MDYPGYGKSSGSIRSEDELHEMASGLYFGIEANGAR